MCGANVPSQTKYYLTLLIGDGRKLRETLFLIGPTYLKHPLEFETSSDVPVNQIKVAENDVNAFNLTCNAPSFANAKDNAIDRILTFGLD